MLEGERTVKEKGWWIRWDGTIEVQRKEYGFFSKCVGNSVENFKQSGNVTGYAALNDPMTFTKPSVGAYQVAVISIIISQL